MPACVFLTIADMGRFVSDDTLAAALLRTQGWQVDELPWDQAAHWSVYDLAVIRTTWDYHGRSQHFLQSLADIERAGVTVLNPLKLVRWNLDKHYLIDLAVKGLPVVPTSFGEHLGGRSALRELYSRFDTQEIIVKPPISASATNTFSVPQAELDAMLPQLRAVFADGPYMVQPFMSAIRSEGEYSLMYFNGRFSHAIRKTPAAGDFRAQEEFGALITAVTPERSLLEAGRHIMNTVAETPLYARVDLVRDGGAFALMELELIEPSLYLRMDPGAPRRFAEAITAAFSANSAAL